MYLPLLFPPREHALQQRQIKTSINKHSFLFVIFQYSIWTKCKDIFFVVTQKRHLVAKQISFIYIEICKKTSFRRNSPCSTNTGKRLPLRSPESSGPHAKTPPLPRNASTGLRHITAFPTKTPTEREAEQRTPHLPTVRQLPAQNELHPSCPRRFPSI